MTVGTVAVSCRTLDSGETVVDWEKVSRTLDQAAMSVEAVAALDGDDLRASKLRDVASATRAAATQASMFETGQSNAQDFLSALDLVLVASAPLLEDLDPDVRFAVVGVRTAVGFAKTML